VKMYQYLDDDIRQKKDILLKPESERTRYERGCVNDFELVNGILYKRRNDRLLYVIPKMKSIAIRFHDLKSHQGVERTVSRILEHYYFPRMRAYKNVTFERVYNVFLVNRYQEGKLGNYIPFLLDTDLFLSSI